MQNSDFPMVRQVPFMGVIWVVNEAMKLGFWNGNPEWCNLGQGQPEVGELEGAPERISSLAIQPGDHAYGPVGGTLEARQAVADMYNRLFRKGMKSQYTADNVSIASGGRLALTRLFAILADKARILYCNPDYTAYEDYLYYQRLHTTPVCEYATAENGFAIPAARFEELAASPEGLDAFVFSNPCNPTGAVIQGAELASYLDTARRHKVLLGIDEFYSHFMYNADGSPASGPCSAASYVEDVDRDPVLIVDGMTKNQRYPGWRMGWTVGPKHCIEMLNRAASALDGGPTMLAQRTMLEALQPERFDAEVKAVREAFARKRSLMLEKLEALDIHPAVTPLSTFYIWASIENLPAPINDADAFFHACLQKKVMTVPGRFFDIRPFRDRPEPEPLRHWVRFSYGPSFDTVKTGLERIEQVIREYR